VPRDYATGGQRARVVSRGETISGDISPGAGGCILFPGDGRKVSPQRRNRNRAARVLSRNRNAARKSLKNSPRDTGHRRCRFTAAARAVTQVPSRAKGRRGEGKGSDRPGFLLCINCSRHQVPISHSGREQGEEERRRLFSQPVNMINRGLKIKQGPTGGI
jgi:hypothetical protein